MLTIDRTNAVDLRKPDGKKKPPASPADQSVTQGARTPNQKPDKPKGTGAVTSITVSVPNSKTKVKGDTKNEGTDQVQPCGGIPREAI